MKTKQQITQARQRLCERVQTPGLSDLQKMHIVGMLNALVWVADGTADSTMKRMLSDEPIAIGKDPGPALELLNALVAGPSPYVCKKCGRPMAHSRLRGLFCMTCQ